MSTWRIVQQIRFSWRGLGLGLGPKRLEAPRVFLEGALYDLSTGVVDFMGRSPNQAERFRSDMKR